MLKNFFPGSYLSMSCAKWRQWTVRIHKTLISKESFAGRRSMDKHTQSPGVDKIGQLVQFSCCDAGSEELLRGNGQIHQ